MERKAYIILRSWERLDKTTCVNKNVLLIQLLPISNLPVIVKAIILPTPSFLVIKITRYTLNQNRNTDHD